MCNSADLIEAEVNDLSADVPQVGADTQPVVDEGAQLLVADGVPHAITGEHQEFICRRALHHTHFWLRWNHLLARGPVLCPLVAEVSQSAWHCQGAVDPLEGHGATRALNTFFLQRAVRFVVLSGEADLPRPAQHGPWVTAVGKVDVIWRNESGHNSGAAPLPALSTGHRVQVLVCLEEALFDGPFHFWRVIFWSYSICEHKQYFLNPAAIAVIILMTNNKGKSPACLKFWISHKIISL